MNKWTLIVPAGGVGSRMGANRPKQYLEIAGKPLLIYTLKALDEHFHQPTFILAMAPEWVEYMLPFLNEAELTERCTIVSGGKERYDSVKNALTEVRTPWVGVHDAVRPFVSQETVERLNEGIAHHAAIIPVVGLKESLRKKTSLGTEAVDRSYFMNVQTPQCFHLEHLQRAYEIPFDETVTDDASLVERTGVTIHTVLGNDENIKITTPIDLLLAKQLVPTL
jgi:2-C-methyl-D-erythritol 4-phosphate cytidylyltransferase